MKAWGRYEIVRTRADADLVLELRFTAPPASCQTYKPLLALAILDTKTHFRLWTLTKQVGDARRRTTWDNNLKEVSTTLWTIYGSFKHNLRRRAEASLKPGCWL
jgi:hypothetical protein